MRASPLQCGIMIGLTTILGTGCAVTRRYPVLPPPVQLVSKTPVRIHIPARGDTAATVCEAWRFVGTVSAVRGDTMEFAAVYSKEQPNNMAECPQGRPGYIVLSSAPSLQAQSARAAPLRTAFTIVLIGTLTILSALFIVGPYWGD